MVDEETMRSYAANIDAFRKMVETQRKNPHLTDFMGRLPRNAAVLDLGCGIGDAAAIMRAAGMDVTCIDASPDMIKAAQEIYGLTVEQRSFDDVNEIGAYDGIWASYSLLHAPKDQMPENLGRLHRALRDGGLGYFGLKIGIGETRDDAGRFYGYYQQNELTDLLRDAGFTILRTQTSKIVGMLGKEEQGINIVVKR
jgi:SAM-dependent methyltransferase